MRSIRTAQDCSEKSPLCRHHRALENPKDSSREGPGFPTHSCGTQAVHMTAGLTQSSHRRRAGGAVITPNRASMWVANVSLSNRGLKSLSKRGTVGNARHPSTQEAYTGRLMSQGSPELYSEALSQNKDIHALQCNMPPPPVPRALSSTSPIATDFQS